MASPQRLARQQGDREPRIQYAALPWRRTADGDVQVLLITSRESRRWVIPKGWPIKSLSPAHSAAQEAFEEAGVLGKAGDTALGVYHYDKRLRSNRVEHVRVVVYPLEVRQERDVFPETGQRDRLWMSAAEAVTLVDEPELQALLAKLGAILE
jgi:8-oxo-dGTP pyrophosphatase MutT (NUDIX family)